MAGSQVMVDTVDGDAEDTSSSGSTIGNSSSPTPAVQQSYEGIPMVQTQPVQLQKQSRQQQGSAGTPDQGSAPSDQGLHLRFVLSPNPTPAAQLLVQRRLEALEGTTAQQTVQQQGQQQELRHAEQHKQEASQQPGAIEVCKDAGKTTPCAVTSTMHISTLLAGSWHRVNGGGHEVVVQSWDSRSACSCGLQQECGTLV